MIGVRFDESGGLFAAADGSGTCGVWVMRAAGADERPPHTLHPTPCALRPTPYTLHPTPFIPHPAPYTLHLTPYTLHRPREIIKAFGRRAHDVCFLDAGTVLACAGSDASASVRVYDLLMPSDRRSPPGTHY